MSTSKKPLITRVPGAGLCFQLASLLAGLTLAFPSENHAAGTENIGRKFRSPEEAVTSLQLATTAADTNALRDILGPNAEELQNPDRVQAMNELKTFSAALAKTNRLMRVSDMLMVLELGDDFWPFPIPIVKKNGSWLFDSDLGMDELLSRRVGKNELATLPVLRAYVDAQREYASSDRDGDEVLEYAQRLISSPGKRDGLHWPPDIDGEESPLGPLVAFAQEEGYSPELPEEAANTERGPFHGYYFKILTRQGTHAPGGKYNYVINGNMIGGFAMVAWPAEYGDSGIMTFIVNQQGRVFQKDLGRAAAKIAKKIHEYDPDPTWKVSPN